MMPSPGGFSADDVLFPRLKGDGHILEAVGNEVDPEDLGCTYWIGRPQDDRCPLHLSFEKLWTTVVM